MASFLAKTVTIFSVCWPHFWQRIRSIVQSDVENFMKRAQGEVPRFGISPNVTKKIEFLGNLDRTSLLTDVPVAAIIQHHCSRKS